MAHKGSRRTGYWKTPASLQSLGHSREWRIDERGGQHHPALRDEVGDESQESRWGAMRTRCPAERVPSMRESR